jgi:photosystem II oxygen-evolving enhancer protein 3
VVVRAAQESRRAVLGGLLAGAVFTVANQASAVSDVNVFDDRKVRDTGFDLIYEARDLDLPQATRDGLSQARGSIEATKKRVKEAESRIDSELAGYVSKAYWTEAREELRRQVGTLRFDLNTLASAKGDKASRKAALDLKKNFFAKVEALDYAIRSKDKTKATSALDATKSSLDSVLSAVL